MLRQIHNIYHKVLVFLHLSPLSLAKKCRIAFGAAVALVLALALSIPYIWMGQLTKMGFLDAERRKSEMVFRNHFLQTQKQKTTPPTLDNNGDVLDVNDKQIRWVSFKKDLKMETLKLDPEIIRTLQL